MTDQMAGGLCRRCYSRERYLRDTARIRRVNRAWREANPDYWKQERFRAAARERRREWIRANPELAKRANRVQKHRYRARLAEARVGERRATDLYALVLESDPCSYCDAPAESTDHIEPLSLGGSHAWENLSAACLRCNSAKHNLPLLRFLLFRAR
jgi:hypothetical protein